MAFVGACVEAVPPEIGLENFLLKQKSNSFTILHSIAYSERTFNGSKVNQQKHYEHQ